MTIINKQTLLYQLNINGLIKFILEIITINKEQTHKVIGWNLIKIKISKQKCITKMCALQKILMKNIRQWETRINKKMALTILYSALIAILQTGRNKIFKHKENAH